MICPLLMHAVTVNAGYVSRKDFELHTDCISSECALWDSKKGQCAILTLAQSSYSLKDAIQVLGQQISTKR